MDRRSLYQIMNANDGSGESILSTMMYAVLPIAKVFVMCFMGFLMASKYVNILTPNGRKLLNRLVFVLLLPCLIFSQLGQAITLEKMINWWFIPVNVVLMSVSGSLIGLIVATIIQPPSQYFKFTIIHIGIGNIGNIPLVLIAALCQDPSNPFGDSDKCSQDGNAYISYGQWVGAIILYTYVYQMLAPPPEGFDGVGLIKVPSKSVSEQAPLLTNVNTEDETLNAPSGKISEFFWWMVEKLKLKQILQPPIIASIFGIVLGTIPVLKNFILVDGSPLFFFTDSCLILGEAMIPCILLALGGTLVDGPGSGSAKLGLKTTIATVFARLILVPPVGLGIVLLADKLGFLPADDNMFRFVLLLQHSMPTSVLSGTVSSLRGCGKEAASILFWVHIFAVFSMTLWVTVFLNILF